MQQAVLRGPILLTCSGSEQPLAKNDRVATEVGSSGGAHSEVSPVATEVASSGGAHSSVSSDDQEVLVLQLQPRHYDAVKRRCQRWEARPIFTITEAADKPTMIS